MASQRFLAHASILQVKTEMGGGWGWVKKSVQLYLPYWRLQVSTDSGELHYCMQSKKETPIHSTQAGGAGAD